MTDHERLIVALLSFLCGMGVGAFLMFGLLGTAIRAYRDPPDDEFYLGEPPEDQP